MALSKDICNRIITKADEIYRRAYKSKNNITRDRVHSILTVLYGLKDYAAKFDSIDVDNLVEGLFLTMEEELEAREEENRLYEMGKDDKLTAHKISYDVEGGEWYCSECDVFTPAGDTYCIGCETRILRVDSVEPAAGSQEPEVDAHDQGDRLIQEANEELENVTRLFNLSKLYSGAANKATERASRALAAAHAFRQKNTNK